LKIMAVYRIRNKNNGKVYIGSTIDKKQRWALHRRQLRTKKHHSVHLQRAWLKYGPAMFVFEVLEVITDQTQILVREQHHIDSTKCCDPKCGYNTAPIAGSNAGRKMSKSARANISKAMRGRTLTPEHRANIAKANKGRRHPPATRIKLRLAAQARPPRKGVPCSSETKKKISAALTGEKHPQFGKPLSEETKKKIGEKAKGRQTFLGRKHSDETKAKMRAARLGKVMSDETKAKVGAANRGRKHSDEARARMRKAHRARAARQPQRATNSPTREKSIPAAEAAEDAAAPARKIQLSPGSKR